MVPLADGSGWEQSWENGDPLTQMDARNFDDPGNKAFNGKGRKGKAAKVAK
jgi:hypothetical protein